MSGALDQAALQQGWNAFERAFETKRLFYRHPYDHFLKAFTLSEWLSALESRLSDYHPDAMGTIAVPKNGKAVRPGAVLSVADAVVYLAAGWSALDSVKSYVGQRGRIDFGNALDGKKPSGAFFSSYFKNWMAWGEECAARLTDDTHVVVLADITGCYEHIDLSLLAQDLRVAKFPAELIRLFSLLLNTWATPLQKGLPQGYPTSDLLAKIYLTSIDFQFQDAGFSHLRYVDDFRIFCKDVSEARRAVVELTSILRQRGLSLQSSKLEFISPEKAKSVFDGVKGDINAVVQHIQSVSDDIVALASGTIDDKDIADFLASTTESEHPLELLLELYDRHIVTDTDGGFSKFNKTVFRYCLRRFSGLGETRPKTDLMEVLRHEPQETETVLAYLTALRCREEFDEQMRNVLSDDVFFDYQRFQILENAYQDPYVLSPQFVDHVRRLGFDSADSLIRAVSRRLLCDVGSPTDYTRLINRFSNESDLGKAEIFCSVARHDKGARNTFYARDDLSFPDGKRAVSWAKARSN